MTFKLPPILKRGRMSLSCNFVLLTVIILSVTLSISTYVNFTNEQNALVEQLRNKGVVLGNFASKISPDAILGYDFVLLDQYMEDIAKEKDIIYSAIFTPEKSSLASYIKDANKHLQGYTGNDVYASIEHINRKDNLISLNFPIYTSGKLIGTVAIGLSKESVQAQSWSTLKNQLLHNGIIILILSVILAIVFRKNAVKPIQNLIDTSERIAQGNLDIKANVASYDELARLAESFNQMTDALNNTYADKDKALEQLKQVNRALESATQAKSVFLANMSHEIRTPLTAILGYSETLQDPEIPESVKQDSIKAIIRNGMHLQSIITNILDLSKIEANKLEVERLPVSLLEIIQDVQTLVSIQAKEKALDCGVDFQFPLPAHINTDPVRLKQILINLCNNAIKFTREGSVKMTISFLPETSTLQFDIVDTGIGLSDEQLKVIFAPFTQADSSTTRRFGGTGLGLHLSKRLAEMLGGQISVESTYGKGSRFTICIDTGPVNQSDYLYQVADIDACTITRQPTWVNKNIHAKILLAEDTVDNQRLFKMQLERLGLQVTIVDNGQAAVEEGKHHSYDLILMDMQMPIMDGQEAVRQLRELGLRIPIIALTANALTDFRDQCMEVGCNDFITKPVDWNLFRETVVRHLLKADHQALSDTPLASLLLQEDIEFQDIVNDFLNRIPQYWKSIDVAYKNRDWETCKRKVHELKGLGGAMGYPELTDMAARMDWDLKNDIHDRLDEQMEQLHALFNRMAAGLEDQAHPGSAQAR